MGADANPDDAPGKFIPGEVYYKLRRVNLQGRKVVCIEAWTFDGPQRQCVVMPGDDPARRAYRFSRLLPKEDPLGRNKWSTIAVPHRQGATEDYLTWNQLLLRLMCGNDGSIGTFSTPSVFNPPIEYVARIAPDFSEAKLKRVCTENPDAEGLIVSSEITGETIRLLKGLPRLAALALCPNPFVTDDQAALLATLDKLKSLCLRHTRISSAAIAAIAGELPALRELDVMCTNIDDVALDALMSHRLLKGLHLSSTNVTSHGLAGILPMNELQVLEVAWVELSPQACAAIGACSQLEYLNAAHTGVTDEGAAWLLRGTNLVSLDLRHTNVTDATLRRLELEETLGWLNIAGCNVSALALRCLSEALPDCELYV